MKDSRSTLATKSDKEPKIGFPNNEVPRVSQPEKHETLPGRMSVTRQEPKFSLFNAIPANKITEDQKSQTLKAKKQEDMMNNFSDASKLWKDIISQQPQGKQEIKLLKASIAPIFPQLCDLFKILVTKLEEIEKDKNDDLEQRSFSDDLIFYAGLGIFHTNELLLKEINLILDNEAIKVDFDKFGKFFDILRTFQDFFFALAKQKCNTLLHERSLAILEDAIKVTYSTLQPKLQSNYKILLEIPTQIEKQKIIATIFYYSLQEIAFLSVFGELENLTKAKYQNILERLSTTFALISQSSIFEKIFSDQYQFESNWVLHNGKYMLSSFDQKRLKIFVQEGKLGEEENIQFSLKYVVVYYNYKILKIISQRVQLNYDEHILSIFSSLIHKNRCLLGSLISQKDKRNAMRCMLLLNENMYIIKSYIVNLAYFSDNLDPMQRQSKYDIIKETAIDCLTLAIKSGMCKRSDTLEEVNQLTIFNPQDFVALLFKCLLLYKKIRMKNSSSKFCVEMVKHVNNLASDLVSRPIATDDSVCFYTYRLYFLSFLQEWDIEILKEKYMKYSEEMSRFLSDFDEEELENDIVKQLKFRYQEIALEMYVKMAEVDCITSIEATIGFIRESFTSERKLYKYFYIMLCLLSRTKISIEKFQEIMLEKTATTIEIVKNIQDPPQTDAFINKEGMRVLFLIYKNAICSYVQTKEQRLAFEQTSSLAPERKSIGSIEVGNYVVQSHIKKLDGIILAYEGVIKMTSAYICALHYSLPIAENFLKKQEFDIEFYQKVLPLAPGRSLTLNLMKILSQHLISNLKKPDLITKYVGMAIEIFRNMEQVTVPFAEEKFFLLAIIGLLEKIITESVRYIFMNMVLGKYDD